MLWVGILIILVLIIGMLFTFNKIGSKVEHEKDQYYSNIQGAEKITNLREYISSTEDTYILYVGRFSCPDCRNFAPFLKKIIDKYNDIKFMLFDTEHIHEAKDKYQDEDKFLSNVMNVNHVPSLLLIQKGKIIYSFSEKEITKENVEKMVAMYE